jgi:hypothetical protein
VQFGLGFFAGRWEPKVASWHRRRPRTGWARTDKVFENGLALIRDRDEIYMRIRYTF